jgi:hypothetical protein
MYGYPSYLPFGLVCLGSTKTRSSSIMESQSAVFSDDEEYDTIDRSMDLFSPATPHVVDIATPTVARHDEDEDDEVEADDGEVQVDDKEADEVEETDEGHETLQLTPRVLSADESVNDSRKVLIFTYSQADINKFPTRLSFGAACVAACGGGKNVNYFAAAREPHKNGGFHYHVSILCSLSVRWKKPWRYLQDVHGIVVNVSTAPIEREFYDGAYLYVTKWDRNYKHGHVLKQHPTHQECIDADKDARRSIAKKANTASSAAAKTRKAASSANEPKSKKMKKEKKIDRLDQLDFIIENKLKTDEELLDCVDRRRREVGDRNIALAFTSLNEKKRIDLIKDAWKMKGSTATVAAMKRSRMDVISDIAANKENCVCQEYGLWLVLAFDVCAKNGIEWKTMSNALHNLLENGRGKHRNLILTGERNCAKTFLLEPLTLVFGEQCFHTPPSSTFGWMGVEKSQVIYLNDYRWKPEHKKGNISWDELLRLLEGHHCTLPAPMNSCSEHIKLSADNDIPIFCTGRSIPRFHKQDENEPQTKEHDTENKMMEERWKVFNLTHTFHEDQKVDIPPCAYCFCKFVL